MKNMWKSLTSLLGNRRVEAASRCTRSSPPCGDRFEEVVTPALMAGLTGGLNPQPLPPHEIPRVEGLTGLL